MLEKCVGVLGATSLVGEYLLPLLRQEGRKVIAFSRRQAASPIADIKWRLISSTLPVRIPNGETKAHDWICLAPIWTLPDYFDLFEAHGARRIVALSSTSRFTKSDSSDLEEQAVASRLADAENRFRTWAENKRIEWVILRPTMIYGLGRDKNISEIARFICRFGLFPVFGKANGLRQPLHAEDVAIACHAAIDGQDSTNRDYNLSGGETLTYREMVYRVFAALGCRPRMPLVPLGVFALAVTFLRLLPRYRHWSTAMAERMNRDMVFDCSDAERDLGFAPRGFLLSRADLPQ